MTHFDQPQYGSALNGLPDPQTQADFYNGVPAKRAIAWVIDGAITFTVPLVFSIATLGLGFFIFGAVWAVTAFLYRVATLTSRSSTWGMRMMAMELRRGDGSRFDGATALLHTAGTYICFATGAQIVSVLMMAFMARGQGLPDLLLSTTALNKRARF